MFQVTDDDFHKAKAALGQNTDLWAYLSTHDGLGNVARVQINPGIKGAIQVANTDNFGQSWNVLEIGGSQTGLVTGVFTEYMDDGYIQRIRFSDNRIYDLHICESELCLYKSTDGCATWSKVWAVNITKC